MVNSSHERRIFNHVHARDYDYSVQINRWFLKPIGAWPKLTRTSRTEWFLAKILNLTCHSLIMFTILPCVLFIMFEDTSTEARIRAIGPMSHWLMGELNYCCLLTKNNKILHCIEQIERDWQVVRRSSDRELMLKSAKVGRFIGCIAALGMNIGVFSFNLITHSRKNVIHVSNVTYSVHHLPCPFYTKLVDTRFSPANEIVFGLQFLSGFIVNSVTVGACGLAAVLAMHACGQLNIVMSKLDTLINSRQEEVSVQRKLGIVVEHHLRTLSFVWYIEEVMHLICLVQLVGCTFNMCMIAYYILMIHRRSLDFTMNKVKKMMETHALTFLLVSRAILYRFAFTSQETSKNALAMYAIVYASMTFNIFIFCYIAERLTEQCKRVGEKVYMTEWYRLPRKTALNLVMIISRSSTVIKITAGKFIQISIATFADVFKTSFAYFNMLRTAAI